MLITGIKSRPIYTALAPDLGGRYHLLVGQGSGGDALLRLLQEMPAGADIHVLYATESLSGTDRSEALVARGLSDFRIFATLTEVSVALDQTLAGCVMGTRLYIAGSESFIGSAVRVAMKYNLNGDEVQRELCGSAARRVYCIHCKAANENVTTNIVKCPGCGSHLLVRDHYSRRLAAYMGVMVDAEAPGELPPIKVVFV
jgi:DNA-directed RNA polymerase subunit RPC12/RpoP